MHALTRTSLLAGVALLLLGTLAAAATIVVRPDGSGDATTISGALALAADGDEILVGPGTYDEQVLVTLDVDLQAEAGPDVTVLDGGMAHALVQIADATVTIAGFTFTRAFAPGDAHGAALLAWQGSQVDVSDCRFVDNVAGWDNGALHARHAGTSVTVSGCEFIGNAATHNGGACGVHTDATLSIIDCVFLDNWTAAIAGACNAYRATLSVTGSVFTGNTGAVGAIIVEESSATIAGNTFHANTSWDHGSVLFNQGSVGAFDHNIVAADAQGVGLAIATGSSCAHTCNIYDANALGAVAGAVVDPSESVGPALFCDPGAGDLALCADSPALPENNACGAIGAFGQGCGPCGTVATKARSWSVVKRLFD